MPDYCRRPLLLPVDNIHPRMLRHLAAADIIFCNGTFYTCPSLFHQLYTIHAMYPLVFGLLRGKDQTIYIRFLQPYQRPVQTAEPSFTITDSMHRLRDCHKQRSHYRFPRGDHQGVFLPLHTMHLEQDLKVWTTDLLQRKRRHYQTGSTSSCVAPSTTERSGFYYFVYQNKQDSDTTK